MKRVLFFGELPPRIIHGVSLSNQLNIRLLEKHFEVTITEEIADMRNQGRASIKKIQQTVVSFANLYKNLLRKRYDRFYSVLYISRLGILKNIFSIIPIKLFHRSTKVILHIHRSDLLNFHNDEVNRVLFAIVYKFTDTFIVLAKSQQQHLQPLLKSKQIVVYNCIDESQIFNIGNRNNKPPKQRVLFLSNFIKEKGLFETLAAIEQLNRIHPTEFVLNCYGQFKDNGDEREVLEKYADSGYIHFHSPVFGDRKNEVLNDSDLIVLPSYNEGMPLVLLEALRLCKPIIITKVGYITEVLGEEYPLYCEHGSVQSLVQSINYFKGPFQKEFNKKKFCREIYQKFSLASHEKQLLSAFAI